MGRVRRGAGGPTVESVRHGCRRNIAKQNGRWPACRARQRPVYPFVPDGSFAIWASAAACQRPGRPRGTRTPLVQRRVGPRPAEALLSRGPSCAGRAAAVPRSAACNGCAAVARPAVRGPAPPTPGCVQDRSMSVGAPLQCRGRAEPCAAGNTRGNRGPAGVCDTFARWLPRCLARRKTPHEQVSAYAPAQTAPRCFGWQGEKFPLSGCPFLVTCCRGGQSGDRYALAGSALRAIASLFGWQSLYFPHSSSVSPSGRAANTCSVPPRARMTGCVRASLATSPPPARARH